MALALHGLNGMTDGRSPEDRTAAFLGIFMLDRVSQSHPLPLENIDVAMTLRYGKPHDDSAATTKPPARALFSLKAKLLLLLLFVSSAIAGLGVGYWQQLLATRLEGEISNHAQHLAAVLSVAVESIGVSPELQQMLNTMTEKRDVKLLLIATGEPLSILAASNKALTGQPATVLPKTVQTELEAVRHDSRPATRWDRHAGEFLYTLPLAPTNHWGDASALVGGVMVAQMDTSRLQDEVRQDVNRFVVLLLGALLLLIGLAYLLLQRFVFQPMDAIQTALKRRKRGDNSVCAPVLARDELGALSTTVNALIDQIGEDERRFRTVVEAIPSAVVVANTQGDIVLVNAQAEQLFGYARDELIGCPVEKLMPEAFAEHHAAKRREYLQTPQYGASISRRGTALCKDGTQILVEVTVSLLQVNGETLILSAIVDITHQQQTEAAIRQLNETLERRVEERTTELAHTVERLNREIQSRRDQETQLVQAQKMEAIGQLTGGVAHDFNNLLTIIKGNLELLQRALADRLDADEEGLVEDALSAARSGAELTSRLLAFSRRHLLNPRRTDLNRLLDELGRILRRVLNVDIALRLDTDPGIPEVIVDAGQLQNALLNLALNARDAMPTGGVLALRSRLVEIKTAADTPVAELTPGRYVEVAVTDSGVGMDEATLRRAFEPFFTTKGPGKGSGLGLAMVYGFAAQSGGGVTVESQPGQGTVVRLLLPAAGAAEPPTLATDAEAVPGGTETILVVEDDDLVRRIATRHLRGLGYTVLEAADAEDAMAILGTEPEIDLVFSDILMPGALDGYALACWVATERPDVQCLLTTGYSGARDQLVPPAGASSLPVLAKPYSREQLARQIRALLDGHGYSP